MFLLYTTKDISSLGSSNPNYRSLLFYNSKSIFKNGWNISEVSKKIGKQFADLDIDFKDLTIYNGVYAFGNFSPFSSYEMSQFQYMTIKTKEWYKYPLIKFNYSLDDYITKP